MRDEYAATSTQMDAAEAHPEEAAKDEALAQAPLRFHMR
jgi:hypothetical protein